mmetsp:Transcript_10250/g.23002  ORF Transcript_10250/g.23002 Transcript_10250/m.23002 type:complete len:93 (-) Transcript_10250:32-310(-)
MEMRGTTMTMRKKILRWRRDELSVPSGMLVSRRIAWLRCIVVEAKRAFIFIDSSGTLPKASTCNKKNAKIQLLENLLRHLPYMRIWVFLHSF